MTEQQEKEYYKMLGEKFKMLRKRAGKTAEDIAAEIGVDQALIYQFENKGKKISAFRINQLLNAFGFNSIESLLETNEDPAKKNSKLLLMATA